MMINFNKVKFIFFKYIKWNSIRIKNMILKVKSLNKLFKSFLNVFKTIFLKIKKMKSPLNVYRDFDLLINKI